MTDQTIRRYQSRAIDAAQVIEELIAYAKDALGAKAMRALRRRRRRKS